MAIRPNFKHLKLEDLPAALDAERTMQRRIRHADGQGAFEAPRRDAAYHEAGHCVAAAASGAGVASTEVFPFAHAPGCWGGFTRSTAGRGAISDAMTVQALSARLQLTVAGWWAEVLFCRGTGARRGSSLDEIAIGKIVAAKIARKTRRSPEGVFIVNCAAVRGTLERNADAVHAIATALMAAQRLSGKKLAALLMRVS